MTTGVVTFDPVAWALRYPELAPSVPNPQVYFDEATLYCNNSACSPVRNVERRTILLNMLTAHIAALNASINCQPPSPLVGRIQSATEGSVTVQVANDYEPGTVQWYQQTKYGSAFYAATQSYRMARYLPSRTQGVPSRFPYR